MKIAVIFRGPLRPTPNKVFEQSKRLLDQLKDAGHEVHSYMFTWTKFNEFSISDLDLELYDNVCAQREPTEDHIRKYITRTHWEGLHATVPNTYKMYYQIKTAIELIIGADDYDRIVHSRTDIFVDFGEFLDDWLQPFAFVTVLPDRDAICDWLNVAPPSIMYAAYNYGDQKDLSYLIDHASIPEDILEHILKTRKLRVVYGRLKNLYIDK